MKYTIALLLALSLSAFSATGQSLEDQVMQAYNAQNYARAAEILQQLANQGNSKAQYNLGLMYDNGQGVAQDYAKAAEWYRKAADQGNTNAQNNLSLLYKKGQGVPQDYAKAAEWCRKAADQGDDEGQFGLGLLYNRGQGVPKDHVKAAEWFRKAADQGHVTAQFGLGLLYEIGQGVPKDDTKAAEWYRKAADRGSVEAKENLERLNESTTQPPAKPAPPRAQPPAAPAAAWATQSQSLGTLAMGEQKTVYFAFTNTGASAISLTAVKAVCGCVQVSWPRTVIAPGAKGQIEATFTAEASGAFTKSITVESNMAGGPVVLYLKGEVRAAAPPPPPAEPPLPAEVTTGATFTRSIGGVELKMIWVPGGAFTMGDLLRDGHNANEKVHAATAPYCYLSETEVTQTLWQAVMGSNPSAYPTCPHCPVENVSWQQVQQFIAELNRQTGQQYRLPTEAEWEYAARDAGKEVRFGNGKNTASPTDINFDAGEAYKQPYSQVGTTRGRPTPVKMLPANALGLYGMSGNVEEWCLDWYGPYPAQSRRDYTGPTSGSARVIRGGSWSSDPQGCRVTCRSSAAPGSKSPYLGFRLALSPQ